MWPQGVASSAKKMAASTSGSKSLKEYLKRYESSNMEEENKKKKKKRKKGRAENAVAGTILVVDKDPVWQKPVNIAEEDNDDDSAGKFPVFFLYC